LTASGAAASPRAMSAAMERFVVVMADPFGRSLNRNAVRQAHVH
jgi:hypothetical protein